MTWHAAHVVFYSAFLLYHEMLCDSNGWIVWIVKLKYHNSSNSALIGLTCFSNGSLSRFDKNVNNFVITTCDFSIKITENCSFIEFFFFPCSLLYDINYLTSLFCKFRIFTNSSLLLIVLFIDREMSWIIYIILQSSRIIINTLI